MKKRAVSAVIASVLIILITIAAISILWAFVFPMVKNITTVNVPVSLEIVQEGYTAWDPINRLAEIQVKRGSDNAPLEGFDFVFELDGNSFSHPIGREIEPNSRGVYYFNFSDIEGNLQMVKLVPVFEDGRRGDVVSILMVSSVSTVPLHGGNYVDPKTGKSTGTGATCASHASYSCYDGDVYYYDSCGNRETLKEDCGSDEYCNDGVCEEEIVEPEPYCGDGNCEEETCESCEEDCGACAVEPEECDTENDCFLVSVNGAGNHDGTSGNEMNLSEAITYSSLHQGVSLTFQLLSGDYGEVNINKGFGSPSAWVSYVGNNARFHRLTITKNGDAYLKFKDINVSYPFISGNQCTGGKSCGALVGFDNSNWLEFDNVSASGYVDQYGGYSSFIGFFAKNSKNIKVKNCEVTNVANGIEFWNGKNIVVSGCEVHRFRNSAIRTGGDSNYLIKNNTVHDYRKVDNSNPEVYGTYHYSKTQACNNAPQGYCDHGGSGIAIHSQNTIVDGNTVYNCCPSRPIWYYYDYAGDDGYQNCSLQNNRVYNVINYVEVSDMGKNFTVKNNTFPQLTLRFAKNATGEDIFIYNNIIANSLGLNQFGATKYFTFEEAKRNFDNVSAGGNVYTGVTSKGCGSACSVSFSKDSTSVLMSQSKIISLFKDFVSGDYHPLINSAICNGSLGQKDVPFAGALPCVCENDAQCKEVFGASSTCSIVTKKCE